MWAFQHFYSGQPSPAPRWKGPSEFSLFSRENGVLVPVRVQAGIPRTGARHWQLGPGALKPGQGSCRLLEAPRRHPLQGVLPGQKRGERGE